MSGSTQLHPAPEPWNETCFIAQGVFQEEECLKLIERTKESESVNIDSRTKPAEVVGDTIRIVERTSLKDEEMAEWLSEKICPLCPKTLVVETDDVHMGPCSMGVWELDTVDCRIQLYRYEPGGVFTVHRDGPIYHTPNLRSFFTVLTYLNSGYKGGNTTVFTEDMQQAYKVEPVPGSCFVMLQKTLHEGSKVEEGVKYAMRCDVLYRRKEGGPEDCMAGLSETEQARKWFLLASCLELSGNIQGSIAYYKRAYRLDPNVEVDVVLP